MQCMTRDFLLEILIKSYLYETGFLLEKKMQMIMKAIIRIALIPHAKHNFFQYFDFDAEPGLPTVRVSTFVLYNSPNLKSREGP